MKIHSFVMLLWSVFSICMTALRADCEKEASILETIPVHRLNDRNGDDSKTDEIVSVLQRKRDEYYSFSETAPDDERGVRLGDSLNAVVNGMRGNWDCVYKSKAGDAETNDLGPVDPRYSIIGAAIYSFIIEGYELSAELLTHSLEPSPASPYVPLHGGVVYSSPITYEAAMGTSTSGSSVFDFANSHTRYMKDLFLAIRKFRYNKPSPSSAIVRILDTYDFDLGGASDIGLIGYANDVFADFQRDGLIHPYEISIETDVSKIPSVMKSQVQDDASVSIDVTNVGQHTITLFYNTKLLYRDEASDWSKITAVNTAMLLPNDTVKVAFSKDGQAANTYAISYFDGSIRIVLSGFAFDDGGGLSLEVREIQTQRKNGVLLMGKNGDKWLFSFLNVFSETAALEYNSFMCFLEDAKTWSNLYHLKKQNVYAGEETFFWISENVFADYVAIRLTFWTYTISMYANELNTNCSLNLNQTIEPIRRFLSLNIKRKYVGSWDIEVTNTYSKHVIVEYNAKMCYDSDAKNWSNLFDIKTINLDTRKTKTVRIMENWFATTIAFSYVVDGTRLVTYANRLTAEGSISEFNVVI